MNLVQPLTECVNGDGHPVQPPSWVLCRACLDVLDAKLHALGASLGDLKYTRDMEPDL